MVGGHVLTVAVVEVCEGDVVGEGGQVGWLGGGRRVQPVHELSLDVSGWRGGGGAAGGDGAVGVAGLLLQVEDVTVGVVRVMVRRLVLVLVVMVGLPGLWDETVG